MNGSVSETLVVILTSLPEPEEKGCSDKSILPMLKLKPKTKESSLDSFNWMSFSKTLFNCLNLTFLSKTDCLRVSKGNVKDDHSHDDFSPAVNTEFCPGDTWKDVSGGAQNWLVLDVMDGQTYVTTTTVHWAMPVAPWTPYADPISMGSDNKPDGVLTFDKNGDGSYNVSVSKE